MVTQSDNVAKEEQKFALKMRHKSFINDRAFRENEESGQASLNWQDSMQSFQKQLDEPKINGPAMLLEQNND